jgi:hypothetical protein
VLADRLAWTATLGLSLSLAVVAAVAGCHKEVVIPFPDSGDPCSGASNGRQIDCAEFGDQTCVVPGSTCPRIVYGCADGGYFETQDDSECPAEAGGTDAAQFGDVSLVGAPDASDAGDASDGSDATSADAAGADAD